MSFGIFANGERFENQIAVWKPTPNEGDVCLKTFGKTLARTLDYAGNGRLHYGAR